jgi:hypothetical protein
MEQVLRGMEDGRIKREITICIDKFDNYVIKYFFDDILASYVVEDSA